MVSSISRFYHKRKLHILQNMDLVGVLEGELAFTGPELVQIDLTNACNNDCIACWCRSPLLQSKRIPPDIENQRLSFDIIEKVLADCALLGTTNIYLAGGGEPFMHPQIMEVVRLIKELGFICHINTNFTRVDLKRADELVALGVDHLIISLWAATPDTYARTHPNKSGSVFQQLIDTIRGIVELRPDGGPPHIVLYNVIMNCNYEEIDAMVNLASDLGVNAVEFTVADVIPGKTDHLLLSQKQRQYALRMCEKIQSAMTHKGGIDGLEIRINDFIKRLSDTGASVGNYDTVMLNEIPCHIGWNFSRILADGNVNACLKAHRMPVGNIYENPFKEIWNSNKQRDFRRKSSRGDVNDSFFSLIGNDERAKVGCYRGCDDIDRNRRIWNRLKKLNQAEKLLLRCIASILRLKKNSQVVRNFIPALRYQKESVLNKSEEGMG